jgi:hypothetical protein
MSKMGLHDPFGHLQHKLWQKEKSKINSIFVHANGMRYIVGKLSTKVTTLLQTSSQSKVWAISYGPTKLQESNLSSFGTPLWESRDKKAIWMWALWRGVENTIWGKVVASPESGPWWVLWIQNRPWLVLAPKVLQHSTNQLCGWLDADLSEWVNCLSFFLVPSQSSSTPLYPFKVLRARECALSS